MKKFLSIVLSLVMVMSLAACGGKDDSSAAKEAPDLTKYYEDFVASLGEGNAPMMMDLAADEAMMEGMYPGLAGYERNQTVLQAAAIGAVAFEFALVECANEGDVEAVKGILQARIDNQINGGAFYPATVEGWQKAELIVNGNVVALIVAGEQQADAVAAFNELF